MRQLRSFIVAVVLGLGVLGLTGSEARAQWYGYSYGPGGVYYAPGAYAYATPGYSYAYSNPGYVYTYPYVTGYTPEYYWTADRYYTPYTRSWNYQAYSPWTNQYRYSYGVRPRWR